MSDNMLGHFNLTTVTLFVYEIRCNLLLFKDLLEYCVLAFLHILIVVNILHRSNKASRSVTNSSQSMIGSILRGPVHTSVVRSGISDLITNYGSI